MEVAPKGELEKRLRKVQAGLQEQGIDAAIVVQNVDLYYLAGTMQQAHLVVPAQGEPTLLVRRGMERARAESALDRIEPFGSLRGLGTTLAEMGVSPSGRIGMELDVLTVNLFRYYQSLLPETDLVDCSGIIREVRSVKSEMELEFLAEAGRQMDLIFREVPRFMEEGISELELAGRLEGFARARGSSGVVRFRAFNQEMVPFHVLSGPDATIPSYVDAPLGGRGSGAAVPQGPGGRTIRRNEPVIIDFVSAVHGYVIDQTRTYCLGSLPAELARAYDTCVAAQEAAAATGSPGSTAAQVYEAARKVVQARGFEEHFMGYGSSRVKFVGHGVGLELDELPVLAQGSERVLAEGNTVACEPKLVFPGVGAVGIENSWQIDVGGFRRLTPTSDEVFEV